VADRIIMQSFPFDPPIPAAPSNLVLQTLCRACFYLIDVQAAPDDVVIVVDSLGECSRCGCARTAPVARLEA
jgi:hypothetical protein